jgi:prepilin-type N-terminal cleavage/methylation domain-containing protein/prepilin-type processing-associated H-X9-DG protein
MKVDVQKTPLTSSLSPSEGARATEALEGSPAFTLIELLAVIAIVAILAGLLLPAINQAKSAAKQAQCTSGLHQLAIAAQMYWDDNSGNCFLYQRTTTNNGVTYWFGWLQNGAEGKRAFDATQGELYPYLKSTGIDTCPSLDYYSPQFKLKATAAAYGYGYNLALSAAATLPPVNIRQVTSPAGMALLADAAQINTFEAPASPTNPMLEEFYYVDATEATAHFRHQERANVLFCDSHIGQEKMVSGSLDVRIPADDVGSLRPQILSLP